MQKLCRKKKLQVHLVIQQVVKPAAIILSNCLVWLYQSLILARVSFQCCFILLRLADVCCFTGPTPAFQPGWGAGLWLDHCNILICLKSFGPQSSWSTRWLQEAQTIRPPPPCLAVGTRWVCSYIVWLTSNMQLCIVGKRVFGIVCPNNIFPEVSSCCHVLFFFFPATLSKQVIPVEFFSDCPDMNFNFQPANWDLQSQRWSTWFVLSCLWDSLTLRWTCWDINSREDQQLFG